MGVVSRHQGRLRLLLKGKRAIVVHISSIRRSGCIGHRSKRSYRTRTRKCRHAAFAYAAKTWSRQRTVIGRIDASAMGTDRRYVVTNLIGRPKHLYEKVYCARGQAENLIKAHKLHLAADRNSCHQATANQFRLILHSAVYWLMHGLRQRSPRKSLWRTAQFDTIRLRLIKLAARLTEMNTRIKVSLPTACPERAIITLLAGQIGAQGP